MIRRRMLAALGLGVLAVALPSFAQQSGKLKRIGFLYFGSRQSAVATGRYDAFRQGLRELGYVEGRDLEIEWRFADGNEEKLAAMVEELLQMKVDLIVTTGSQATRTVVRATTTLPIIITAQTDPVGNGLGRSLAKPAGNVTGFYTNNVETIPKLFQLLKLAVPKVSRVAALTNPGNTTHPPQIVQMREMAHEAGIQLLVLRASTPVGIEQSFAEAMRQRSQGFLHLGDTFFVQQEEQIAKLALKDGLPSIAANPAFTTAGGLMSYGSDTNENFRRAAAFVDKILKGAKPGDLPFEQSVRYYLTINRKTAKAIGLVLPEELLLRADRVIE